MAQKVKPAKIVIGENDAVMYPPSLYWQIPNDAKEIVPGEFNRSKKNFVSEDGSRQFEIREQYWATEISGVL